jgi:hypothetical protein
MAAAVAKAGFGWLFSVAGPHPGFFSFLSPIIGMVERHQRFKLTFANSGHQS